MTQRQARFVQEYLVDLCGSAAARRAGYAHGSARTTAWRLLRIPEVRKQVDEAMENRARRVQVEQDAVLRELQQVAFASASDENGAAVKLGSKLRALELLGKHIGLFEGRGQSVMAVKIVEDV